MLRHAFLSQATRINLPSPIVATPDGSIFPSSFPVSAVKKEVGGWTTSTCSSCACTGGAGSSRTRPRNVTHDADRIRHVFLFLSRRLFGITTVRPIRSTSRANVETVLRMLLVGLEFSLIRSHLRIARSPFDMAAMWMSSHEHTTPLFSSVSLCSPTKERLAAIRGTAPGHHTDLKCAPL